MTPILIQEIIKDNIDKDFICSKLYLQTTIGNVTGVKRIKFRIFYDISKVEKIDNIIDKLSVDLNTFIITYKDKTPNYIYPIAFPDEIFDDNIDVNSVLKHMRSHDVKSYNVWRETLYDLEELQFIQ